MTFRVAEPETVRISVASAFHWILEGSYSGEPDKLAFLFHMAAIRVSMANRAPPGSLRSTLPDCPEFSVDPIDVANLLLHGISTGVLSVGGANDGVLSEWCRRPWLLDWEKGIVELAPRGFVSFRFCPTLDISEVERLFTDEGQQDAGASQADKPRPISAGALRTFLEALEGEKIKEADAKSQAKEHFGRTPPRTQWRNAWKAFPRRRKPGEHDRTLSKQGA